MKVFIYIISILIAIWSFKKETPYQENIIDKSINNVLEEDDNNSFSGIWINEDERTRSITKCNIRYDNNLFYVQIWGSCHPLDCDWGERASNEVENETNKFDLFFDQGFVERTLTLEIIDRKLKLTEQSHYKDNSGRSDYTLIEYFTKQ